MLSVENIERLLAAINERLREQNVTGTIVLAGGVVMALIMRSREATFDIDALFEPADKIREIAQQIAIKEGLEEDWINDGVKGFVDTKRNKFPSGLVRDLKSRRSTAIPLGNLS